MVNCELNACVFAPHSAQKTFFSRDFLSAGALQGVQNAFAALQDSGMFRLL